MISSVVTYCKELQTISAYFFLYEFGVLLPTTVCYVGIAWGTDIDIEGSGGEVREEYIWSPLEE